MMADPEVSYWLGATVSREAALAHPDRFEAHWDKHAFGFYAIERRADGRFLGAAGLMAISPSLPAAPGVEIGWRLAREAWGAGYASEAAQAVLSQAWTDGISGETLAFTATTNLRSQAVMARLGMTRRPDLDFDHPSLAQDHPLRPHVVYAARAPIPGGATSH